MDLLDAPKRSTWQPKLLQPTDLEVIAAIITAGLRAGEVINLENGDAYLKSDPPILRVTGKGDKPRTVTIPPETVTAINDYLTDRRQRMEKPSPGERLLIRADGRPCTRSVVDRTVRRWLRRAGRTPPKGALAHSLRHTYATLLIENGASLPEVRWHLGHADLSTTQPYIGVTGKGLEEASLANPARRLLKS